MATFEDYLNSLGAEQVGLGYSNVTRDRSNDMSGTIISVPGTNFSWEESGGRLPEGFTGPKYNYGEKPYIGGQYGSPAYVDASGGFLGYGASPDQLTNPNLLRGYSDFIAQNPAREAQQIANRQATQDLFEQRQTSRLAQQQALPNINKTFASQLTGSPQGFSGFGGPMPGFGAQQQQTQAGVGARPGLLGGLHRGKFGGTGLLGGSGQ